MEWMAEGMAANKRDAWPLLGGSHGSP